MTIDQLATSANAVRADCRISPRELQRWLLSGGLAVVDEHKRLRLTEHGREISAGLRPDQSPQ